MPSIISPECGHQLFAEFNLTTDKVHYVRCPWCINVPTAWTKVLEYAIVPNVPEWIKRVLSRRDVLRLDPYYTYASNHRKFTIT